jgi:branched-chain amino acid transport system substrate-binding protein
MVRARGLSVLIVAAFVAFACGPGGGGGTASKGTITIGVSLPLSGEEASQGTPTKNGVLFYVKQHPTIDGFNLKVVSKDYAVNGSPDATRGAAVMQELIGDSTVLGVVGTFDSGIARASIPLANTVYLAMISPANTNPCLTKTAYTPGFLRASGQDISCKDAGLPSPADLRKDHPDKNNYFRLATTDDLQGPANSLYAYNTLKLTKVAVISNNSVYGKGIADTFSAEFLKLGGKVVLRQDYDPKNTNDFKPFLTTAKANGAQAVYYGGLSADKGCVIRQQMVGIFPTGEATPFLGGDGIAQDPACTKDAGSTNAIGVFGTVASVNPDQVPSAASTISAFKAAYPNSADYGSYSMVAYDCAGIIVAAIDKAIKANNGNMPTRDAVRAAIAATSGYAGVTGTIGFDQNGDNSAKIVSLYEDVSADPTAQWKYIRAYDFNGADKIS